MRPINVMVKGRKKEFGECFTSKLGEFLGYVKERVISLVWDCMTRVTAWHIKGHSLLTAYILFLVK